MPSFADLQMVAEQLGVVIVDYPPRGGWQPGQRGAYDHDQATIHIYPKLSERQAKCTLAHELGHAAYGDTGSSPAVEARAWRYAARLLISPADYAAAERLHGCHAGALAVELDVTRPVVEAFQAACEKHAPESHIDAGGVVGAGRENPAGALADIILLAPDALIGLV